MKLYKHLNYEEYVRAQKRKNIKKLKRVFATNDVIVGTSNYIKKNISNAKFGICHGVRNGWEVKKFRQNLKIEIIGTEISPTATQFENVIQWDFHEAKPEWVNNVDFIYSNSFDHSYDPYLCLDRWMSCIVSFGACFVEWHKTEHNVISPADCFSASIDECKQIFEQKYRIEDIVDYSIDFHKFMFIIKHRN